MNLKEIIKKYKYECIFGPLLKLAEAVFELLVPFVIMLIIEKGVGEENKRIILIYCIILCGMSLFGLIFASTAQYFSAKAACGICSEIKKNLLRKVISLPESVIEKIGKTTLYNRMTLDIDQIQNGINLSLRLLLRAPVIVFGSLILSFTVNSRIAVIFCITIPILALIIFFVMLKSVPIHKKTSTELDKLGNITDDTLSGIKVIRGYNKQKFFIDRFENISCDVRENQKKAGRINSYLNPATFAVVNIALSLIIGYGAKLYECNMITVAGILALNNYMSQILVELIKFANLTINISKSIASGKRINEIMNITGEKVFPKEDAINSAYSVEIDKLSFSYSSGEQNALSDISVIIPKNKIIGLIGGTGSGKSTLAKIICGLYDNYSGSVKVNGIDCGKTSLDQIRSSVTYVSQNIELFKGSVRKNMRFVNSTATDEEIYRALKKAQCEFINSLDFEIEENGENLSGGQKQRLSIARGFLKKSDLYIFDDSFSALDNITTRKIFEELKKISDNSTIIVISQRLSVIRKTDYIIVMDNGSISEEGTDSELIKKNSIYSDFFNSQKEGDYLD